MRQKKAFLLSLLLISSLLFPGCFGPIQLADRAIVQAVGIDWKDNRLEVCFQIFSPASEGTNINATSDNAKILRSTGANVSEAIQNATMMQGKELFFGQNRIVILGKELAGRGIKDILTYFSSNPFSRQNIHVAMAEGKASDILSAKINQGILPAEALEKIIDNVDSGGIVPAVKLFEFLKTLQNNYDSAVLPVLSAVPEESADKGSGSSGQAGGANGSSGNGPLDSISSIELSGTGIFRDGKLVGELDRFASRGLQWIRDSIETTDLFLSNEKYESATLRVFSAKSTLIPSFQGEEISFLLKISCKASLGENSIREGQEAEMADLDLLADAGEELIRRECEAAFQAAILEQKADVFNFGNIVWRENRKIWENLRTDWGSHVDSLRLEVEPSIRVDGIGTEFHKTAQP